MSQQQQITSNIAAEHPTPGITELHEELGTIVGGNWVIKFISDWHHENTRDTSGDVA